MEACDGWDEIEEEADLASVYERLQANDESLVALKYAFFQCVNGEVVCDVFLRRQSICGEHAP